MSKFDNRRRSGKVAMMLLSTLFSGSNSQAKEMKGFDNKNLSVQSQSFSINKNDAKSPQSLERVGGAAPITQRKFFKPLVIAASALVAATAAGLTIWGLTRNKKESDTPKKENDNKGNIKSEVQGEKGEKSKKEINEQNNEKQIITEKEIAEHNKNLICNAIELAKQGKKLHCDENLLRDAMFELFGRLANIKYEDKAWGVVSPLWKFFHKKKMTKIVIEEFTNEKNENENGVFLYLDNDDPKEAYGITWLPDNKVSISFSTEIFPGIFAERMNLDQIFENLKSPFEVKN